MAVCGPGYRCSSGQLCGECLAQAPGGGGGKGPLKTAGRGSAPRRFLLGGAQPPLEAIGSWWSGSIMYSGLLCELGLGRPRGSPEARTRSAVSQVCSQSSTRAWYARLATRQAPLRSFSWLLRTSLATRPEVGASFGGVGHLLHANAFAGIVHHHSVSHYETGTTEPVDRIEGPVKTVSLC